jgi:DNA-directed RNA polymerase specialized sigma24 family protein
MGLAVLLGGVYVSRGLAVAERVAGPSQTSRRDGLDERSLQRLLAALDADPARASERYEALRLRLMRVFMWERQPDAESLADLAIDRVARRVNEGVEVVDVPAYAHRVAELILLEARRAGQRREAALDAHVRLSPPDRSSAAVERRHGCLEACLARLDPEQRDLILRYYSADGRARIEQRDDLAKAHGIPLGALRNRALRLREKLEACITGCLSRRDSSGPTDTTE